MNFERALRGLQATIGVALEPLVDVFADLMDQIADELEPAMEALAPIVKDLAEAFASGILPVVQVFSTLLQALAPVLKDLAALFKTWIQKVISALILFIGALARIFGADAFLDRLIHSLEGGNRGRGQVGAVQNVHIAGLEAISNQLATASAIAGGRGGGPRTTEDWLREVVNQLREIQNGEVGTLERIRVIVQDIINWLRNHQPTLPTLQDVWNTHNTSSPLVGTFFDQVFGFAAIRNAFGSPL
jgi:hypothetical protein